MKTIFGIAGVLLALAAVQHGNPGVALLLGVVVLILARTGMRVATGHSHPGPLARSARHEAGHMAAARAVGGTVTSAELYPDGGGVVWARIPDTPQARATFLYAGAEAAGTTRGADYDLNAAWDVLREVPAEQRHQVRHVAMSDARRIVRRHAGQIETDAVALVERGRL